MMIRPGLGQDTIPDTGHGHGDNLGKLDSVIPIPSAVWTPRTLGCCHSSLHHSFNQEQFLLELILSGCFRLLFGSQIFHNA